ncbi:MAG: ATP-binding protein [Candidatus Eisenbacteria bacterium]|nr:ATP-binding protein [Candidatus Eisenbacteria bacterium]
MRVHSIRIENYRPFADLSETRLGQLATLVGKNDSGKSSILRALQTFLEEKPGLASSDIHHGSAAEADVVIEVAFSDLPDVVCLEESVETTLAEENLLDASGHLRLRKTYPRSNLGKFRIEVIVRDYANEMFSGLAALKEKELNERCAECEIETKKSGRGITNKGKRASLRAEAEKRKVKAEDRALELPDRSDLWRTIKGLLPGFVMFEADTRLGVEETSFQGQFRSIIRAVSEHERVRETRESFSKAIQDGLQVEIDRLFELLTHHTDAFSRLSAHPSFTWDKAVTFDIYGTDGAGVETSVERRGSGLRRLMMVAFFQYLAERGRSAGDTIFGIEEPENCLHPALQRELVTSLRTLTGEGTQIVISSHSPVFAGASPVDDLALVVREADKARAVQAPELDRAQIASELGVEPADQITGFDACVFVEGPDDVFFFQQAARILKEAGHVDALFEDKNIGFIPYSGDCLKHWIDLRAMKRLNRRFAVIVDSDRKSASDTIPGRKMNWKRQCESDGGVFHILNRREIENYVHEEAIKRAGLTLAPYDAYADMKATFGPRVHRLIEGMTCDELLEMDRLDDGGGERHEIRDLIQTLLGLPEA